MDDIAMMYDVFSIKKYQIPYRSMNISYQNWVFKKHHLGLAAMVEGYLKGRVTTWRRKSLFCTFDWILLLVSTKEAQYNTF